MNMNPAADDERGIRGRALDPTADAGGDLGQPTRAELQNLAACGNANAIAALMASSMKRQVLASRY
jgi:hypothetical protein